MPIDPTDRSPRPARPDAPEQSAATVPANSRLARLQQALVVVALTCTAAWLIAFLPDHPGWAMVGPCLLVGGHAAVLGLEFWLAARFNRTDTVPRAGILQWLAAWWQEVKVAPVVFAWRQPFRWKRCPDHDADTSQGATPVVLVHGFVCNRGLWIPWMKQLRASGIPFVSVNLEPVFGSIDDYARCIEEAVVRAERQCGKPPLLVGHSMGGLASRAWLAAQSNPDRVAGVVTIGTPHRGTWLARFSHVTNGRQMQIGGAWLTELERRERAERPDPYARFVCWYSNTDNIVFPASTATLPGADNRLLPGAAHVALAFEPAVFDAVKRMALGAKA